MAQETQGNENTKLTVAQIIQFAGVLMAIGLLAGFVIVAERVFRLSVLTVSKSAAGLRA